MVTLHIVCYMVWWGWCGGGDGGGLVVTLHIVCYMVWWGWCDGGGLVVLMVWCACLMGVTLHSLLMVWGRGV